jgi:hypothetical protein
VLNGVTGVAEDNRAQQYKISGAGLAQARNASLGAAKDDGAALLAAFGQSKQAPKPDR